MKIKEVTE